MYKFWLCYIDTRCSTFKGAKSYKLTKDQECFLCCHFLDVFQTKKPHLINDNTCFCTKSCDRFTSTQRLEMYQIKINKNTGKQHVHFISSNEKHFILLFCNERTINGRSMWLFITSSEFLFVFLCFAFLWLNCSYGFANIYVKNDKERT